MKMVSGLSKKTIGSWYPGHPKRHINSSRDAGRLPSLSNTACVSQYTVVPSLLKLSAAASICQFFWSFNPGNAFRNPPSALKAFQDTTLWDRGGGCGFVHQKAFSKPVREDHSSRVRPKTLLMGHFYCNNCDNHFWNNPIAMPDKLWKGG